MIKIGCCGFPVRRKKYVSRFQVVEVQETFYQPPKPETARRWRLESPPEFEFALKAWQLITHEASSPTYRRLRRALNPEERHLAGSFKDTPMVRQAWEATRELARILSARFILFQCPASFSPSEENLARLGRFFRQIERDEFLFAWEPRGGWPPELVAGLCRELDLIPALDPFSAAPYPGPLAYFRLHGKGGYRYTYTDEDLVELKAMVAGCQEAYVFFNNLSMWQDACRFVEIAGS